MAKLEKAVSDMRAELFVKEIARILKEPENLKILWKAYSDLPHNFDYLRSRISDAVPISALPSALKKANNELSAMLGMDSSLCFRQNLSIIQTDIMGRSYFVPPATSNRKLGPFIAIHSRDMAEVVLYPVVAHELAHFFQNCMNPGANKDWENLNFLKEGFARGVQRIIAENEARRQRKLSYLNNVLTRLYNDITEFASNGYGEDAEKKLHYEGHWGSCAFLVAEARHGKGIYREILNSEKPAKLLVDMLGGRQ